RNSGQDNVGQPRIGDVKLEVADGQDHGSRQGFVVVDAEQGLGGIGDRARQGDSRQVGSGHGDFVDCNGVRGLIPSQVDDKAGVNAGDAKVDQLSELFVLGVLGQIYHDIAGG